MVVTAFEHPRNTRWRREGKCVIESGFSGPQHLFDTFLMDRCHSCMLHRQQVTFLLASLSNKVALPPACGTYTYQKSQPLS
jgi:hypothetical protein